MAVSFRQLPQPHQPHAHIAPTASPTQPGHAERWGITAGTDGVRRRQAHGSTRRIRDTEGRAHEQDWACAGGHGAGQLRARTCQASKPQWEALLGSAVLGELLVGVCAWQGPHLPSPMHCKQSSEQESTCSESSSSRNSATLPRLLSSLLKTSEEFPQLLENRLF